MQALRGESVWKAMQAGAWEREPQRGTGYFLAWNVTPDTERLGRAKSILSAVRFGCVSSVLRMSVAPGEVSYADCTSPRENPSRP